MRWKPIHYSRAEEFIARLGEALGREKETKPRRESVSVAVEPEETETALTDATSVLAIEVPPAAPPPPIPSVLKELEPQAKTDDRGAGANRFFSSLPWGGPSDAAPPQSEPATVQPASLAPVPVPPAAPAPVEAPKAAAFFGRIPWNGGAESTEWKEIADGEDRAPPVRVEPSGRKAGDPAAEARNPVIAATRSAVHTAGKGSASQEGRISAPPPAGSAKTFFSGIPWTK